VQDWWRRIRHPSDSRAQVIEDYIRSALLGAAFVVYALGIKSSSASSRFAIAIASGAIAALLA